MQFPDHTTRRSLAFTYWITSTMLPS